MKRGAAGDAATVALAFSEVGGVRLAVEAGAALEFGLAGARAPSPGLRWLDAARLLGCAPPPQEGRRWARFEAPGARFALLLGEALEIRPVALSALHPLPELLAAAATRLGCAGLVADSDRFCFLLDPGLLAGLAERTDCPDPAV